MNYQKAITFSYDDGIESDRKLVEIFNRYGMKCTFNLNTGIQSRESHFDIEGKEICRMDQETIGDLYQGHEIAVHGLTHCAPVDLSEEQMDQEYQTDIDNIVRLYGQRPIGMAYAYGAYDEATVDYLLRHGIRYGRTVEATHGFAVPEKPILLKQPVITTMSSCLNWRRSLLMWSLHRARSCYSTSGDIATNIM